jgi:O-antigen ligase
VSLARLQQGLWRGLVLSLPLFFNPFSRFNFESDKAILFRALVLLLLAAAAASGQRFRWRPVDSLVLALWGWISLATLLSIEPGQSFWGEPRWGQGWLTLTGFLIVFWLAAQSLGDPGDRERLVDAMLFASLPVCLYGLVQRAGLDPLTVSAPWERIQSSLPHANALGGYLVMVMPFSLRRALQADGRRRWLWWGLLVVQGLCLILTFSRSSWLAALGGLWVYGILWSVKQGRRTQVRLLAGAAVVVGLLLVGLSLLPVPTSSASNLWRALTSLFRASSPTVQVRLLAWEGVIRAVAARPFFGFGPETLDLALPRFMPSDFVLYGNLSAIAGRAHNTFLEMALFVGLPALAIFIGLLAWVGRSGWRAFRRDDDPLALPLLVALGAGLLHDAVDVQTITTGAYSWLMMGMLTTPTSPSVPDAVSLPILRKGIALIAILLIPLISFWPLAADIVGRQGLALKSVESWDDAEATFAAAERLDPRPNTYTSLRAEVVIDQDHPGADRLADAVSLVERALARTPTDLTLRQQLVRLRLAQARQIDARYWPAAHDACRGAMRTAPNDPNTYLLCGDLHLWERQPAGALPYYLTAAELSPAYYQPDYNLATVYRWLGDPSTADAYIALGDAKQAVWQAELAAR